MTLLNYYTVRITCHDNQTLDTSISSLQASNCQWYNNFVNIICKLPLLLQLQCLSLARLDYYVMHYIASSTVLVKSVQSTCM